MNLLVRDFLTLECKLRDLPPDDRMALITALSKVDLDVLTLIIGIAGARCIEDRLFHAPRHPIAGKM
jgi:hypothetical protein